MAMRRITKKYLIFTVGVLFTYLYCEYLIYYVAVFQCAWPLVNPPNGNLKALIIADTHLAGPRKTYWLDKWRREFQMQQSFRAIMTIHKPDVVFVLGDLFDEGELSNEKQFEEYVTRFFNIFSVPNETSMYVVAGNHDIGYYYSTRRLSAERFSKTLSAPPVQLITLKGNNFVLLNSMAMKGDSCRSCTEARNYIDKIPELIKTTTINNGSAAQLNTSRPILMQHFPLYRESDALCTEPDAPPLPVRNRPFRIRFDALSPEATMYLIEKIRPRAAFGGHTHHGCLVKHSYQELETEFSEHSVPSFSWRYRRDPKYMLVTFSPFEYAVRKCGLPLETTMAITAVILLCMLLLLLLKKRSLGRG